MDRIRIETTDLETALHFRMTLSEPPRGREAALSPGDASPDCVHFCAIVDGRAVGVCSVGPEPLPVLDHPPGWRLRGLMVQPEFRKRGIGAALMRHRLQHVASLPHPYAWGYAKAKLAPLYSRQGYCPTGFTYRHPVGGETLLFGNEATLGLIRDALGVDYSGGRVPSLGTVEARTPAPQRAVVA